MQTTISLDELAESAAQEAIDSLQISHAMSDSDWHELEQLLVNLIFDFVRSHR